MRCHGRWYTEMDNRNRRTVSPRRSGCLCVKYFHFADEDQANGEGCGPYHSFCALEFGVHHAKQITRPRTGNSSMAPIPHDTHPRSSLSLAIRSSNPEHLLIPLQSSTTHRGIKVTHCPSHLRTSHSLRRSTLLMTGSSSLNRSKSTEY